MSHVVAFLLAAILTAVLGSVSLLVLHLLSAWEQGGTDKT